MSVGLDIAKEPSADKADGMRGNTNPGGGHFNCKRQDADVIWNPYMVH